MKLRLAIVLLVLFLLGAGVDSASAKGERKTHTRRGEKIFIDWAGVGKELVVDTVNGQLRIRKAKVLTSPFRYEVDGLIFKDDQRSIVQNYNQHKSENKLAVKNGELNYEGSLVSLPDGVLMRNVWQAVLWNDWIICLGRTSNTDKEAQLKPPFFATELITFSVKDRKADVRYLSFNAPSDIRIHILESKRRSSG